MKWSFLRGIPTAIVLSNKIKNNFPPQESSFLLFRLKKTYKSLQIIYSNVEAV